MSRSVPWKVALSPHKIAWRCITSSPKACESLARIRSACSAPIKEMTPTVRFCMSGRAVSDAISLTITSASASLTFRCRAREP